jgi:competence protein ComEA
MAFNREPIKNWFGFTRRERRSTFIMLILVLLIIGFRYTIPESHIDIDIFTDTLLYKAKSHADTASGKVSLFDPNTASYDGLLKSGLVPKEARTIMSYRNKGGRFRQPSDIKKVYGIDSTRAEELVQFVNVKKPVSYNRGSESLPHLSKIDINKSDSSELVSLPGIGPVLSARIIKYRRLLGGYVRVDQLKEVYGLSAETFELIKERVFADSVVVERIKINSAGYRELTRFPYFEKYEVTSILKYREIKGRINSISDLAENKLITIEKAARIRPYLNFDE